MSVITKLRPRRDTAANWTASNPTLAAGEIGIETDSGRTKFGGIGRSLPWNSSPYLGAGETAANPKGFGAISDGASHPLSDYFATLAAAQAVYPHAAALTDELDWAAIQAAINSCPSSAIAPSGGLVYLPTGHYVINRKLTLVHGLRLQGASGGKTEGYNVWLDGAAVTDLAIVDLTGTVGAAVCGMRITPQGGLPGGCCSIKIDHAYEFLVEDLYFAEIQRSNILCSFAEFGTVRRVISEGALYGISILASKYITVQECLWSNCPGGAGYANVLISQDSHVYSENIQIFDAITDEAFGGVPVYRIGGARHVTLIGTKIFGTDGGWGLMLISADAADTPTDVTLIGCRIQPWTGPDTSTNAIELHGSGHKLVNCTIIPNGGNAIIDATAGDTQLTGVYIQAVARGSGGAFAALAGETFDVQFDALGWQTITMTVEATLAAAVTRINAHFPAGMGGASQHIGGTGQVDLWSFLAGPAGRVRTRNVAAGITAKLGIQNNVDVVGVIRNTIPGLAAVAYANNAAALAAGLVAGDVYTIAGSDPRAVAVAY